MKGILELIFLILLIFTIVVFVKWCNSPEDKGLKQAIQSTWSGDKK